MSVFFVISSQIILLSYAQNGIIGPDGPDLTLDAGKMANSLYIAFETYDAESCEVNECLMHLRGGTFPITRKLLRFDTRAANIGNRPFNMGNPFDDTNLNFVYDPCHRHYHFNDFAEYQVFLKTDVDEITNLVPETGKRAFCLMDSEPTGLYNGPRRSTPRFNCDFQGISVGWEDVYGANLDCQFVDVTDLPDGEYKLCITLNPSGRLQETDLTNNKACLDFTLGSNGEQLPGLAGCNVARQDWLGDGYCDRGAYNTAECQWDMGDCCSDCCRDAAFTCGVNEYQCLDPNCEVLETPQMSEINCQVPYIGWVGDGYCDGAEYNTAQCNWDGGDCCPQTCTNGPDYTCGSSPYNCINPDISTT